MSFYQTYLENATRHGLVKEADIDRALINNYIVLMRVGLFDGQPAYDSLNQNDICSADHVQLATDAARQGVVLLKNENNVLPLNTTAHKTIAAVGPHANATHVMIGNYAGTYYIIIILSFFLFLCSLMRVFFFFPSILPGIKINISFFFFLFLLLLL